MRNFFWVVACLATLAGVGILLGLRSYQVFTGEELVAVVRCEKALKGSGYEFFLEVAPVIRGALGNPERFPMHGDQWSIGGEILKWHPWVTLLGLRSCHKLTRIGSRYLKAEAETTRPRSAYDLNGGTDPLWRWLYRFGSRLPLVEAVYGNAAYTTAQPGSQWGVYVTLSGYLVKPLRSGTLP